MEASKNVECSRLDREQFTLALRRRDVRCRHGDRLAKYPQHGWRNHIDRMTSAATVFMIGSIARIVTRHEPGTGKVRDRPADIGAAYGEDLLFNCMIDTRGIGLEVAS